MAVFKNLLSEKHLSPRLIFAVLTFFLAFAWVVVREVSQLVICLFDSEEAKAICRDVFYFFLFVDVRSRRGDDLLFRHCCLWNAVLEVTFA